jgi:predicted alpha-1,2-mannosidase
LRSPWGDDITIAGEPTGVVLLAAMLSTSMMSHRLLPVLLFGLIGCGDPKKDSAEPESGPIDLVSMVDPFIATGGIGFAVGSGFPGAAWPFGLVRVSPDTSDSRGNKPGFHHCGGYHYGDESIEGFSHLHLHGIGVPAHGVITLMPVDGFQPSMMTTDGYRAQFSHDDEHAEPGLYQVSFDSPQVEVALTATPNTALHRYRFGDAVERPTVVLDLGHTLPGGEVFASSIELDSATGDATGQLTVDGGLGGTFTAWVRIRFDQPVEEWGSWADGVGSSSGASGTSAGAWFTFSEREVHARVRISLVGPPSTVEDDADVPLFDFDANVAAVQAAWRESLSPFKVWGGTEDQQVQFATALYHTQLMPQVLSDGGQYPGFDGENHSDEGRPYYSDFSLWDTYRTTHPLYTLAWPNRHRDMLESLLRMVEDGGGLPRWPLGVSDSGSMIGQPAGIVLGEAAAKGLVVSRDGVGQVIANAVGTGENDGRPHQEAVLERGYYASDEMGGSVAWTQEMAISDHALSLFAQAHGEEEASATLAERAHWWKNLWDADAGWFHGRLSSGEFQENLSEDSWEDEFVEGNARQYLWLAPHDPEGLFEVLGGTERSIERLEEMMVEGQLQSEDEDYPDALYGTWYWHGNEPGLHIPWLFALAGAPDETRRWVHWVLENEYQATPDGLAGNDDGGTLSAWYVWAALGVYPLAGTDRYVLGAPMFERVEIHPDDGAEPIVLTRSGDGFQAEITRNGEPWSRPDFTHADLPATTWDFTLE